MSAAASSLPGFPTSLEPSLSKATAARSKIHYDFNHNRTLSSVLPLLQQLQDNHAGIVGFIEDPVRATPTPTPYPLPSEPFSYLSRW